MRRSSRSQCGRGEGERPQPYLLRLSEHLIFEFLGAEFSGGSLTASSVRPTITRLSDVMVEAGGYSGPPPSQHPSPPPRTPAPKTPLAHPTATFVSGLPPPHK